MSLLHIVRVGQVGQIGRFRGAAGHFARGDAVICRTARGLEVGEALGVAETDSAADVADGQLLRRVTPDDQLIIDRLERTRHAAYQACAALVEQRGLDAVLIDVEHLFDGESLFFYFLGPVGPEIEQLTAALADAYETKAQFRQFAQTLAEGCGPDCGEKEGGCGDDCGGCSLAAACGSRH